MPEGGGANIEIVKKLAEEGAILAPEVSRAHKLLELLEAMVLALVAVATAWSGYQAARWGGLQSELYGRSSKSRITAQGLQLKGGQQHNRDAYLANEWLEASFRGELDLA